ncbi:hypothetical protein DMC30DRAFT_415302 [Rhodotorula diobovata]|uniref:SAP domain-containing protein n=1 Tax=Rhodotorula diobovata TaxID=5288 RepID=A0A5C5FZU7_9BASI|nr:hypothetical protein DMC30DRAFT_415302 [Rhodotorula diobovata]
MSHSEADLKALTVVKLKELLAARSLPVTGKKDDLIARLLANPDAPLTADSTGPASATDEPDGTGLSGTAEAGAAATGEGERSAGQTGEALGKGGVEAEEAKDGAEGGEPDKVLTEEEKKAAQAQVDADKLAAARLEEDKRAARAARFGAAAPSAEATAGGPVDESAEAKKKRAERFGLEVDADKKSDDKLNKSLAALDAPLGANKRQREPKKPLPTSKNTGAPGEKGVVGAAAEKGSKVDAKSAAAEPAAAVAADPELKKKLEEEEEKKRKRAERFGPPPAEAPQEKKTKVDA